MSILKMIVLVVCLVAATVDSKSVSVTEDNLDNQLTDAITMDVIESDTFAGDVVEPGTLAEDEEGSESTALEDSINNIVEEILASRMKRSQERMRIQNKKQGSNSRHHSANSRHSGSNSREKYHRAAGFYHIPPSRLQLREDPGFFYVPPRTE